MIKNSFFLLMISTLLFSFYQSRAVSIKELLDSTMQSGLYKMFTCGSALGLTGLSSYQLWNDVKVYRANKRAETKNQYLKNVGKSTATTLVLGSLTLFAFYYSNKGWYICGSCSRAL